MTFQTKNLTDKAAIYDFRVVDDQDQVMSDVKLELLHPKDVLVMATLVANEIRLSHPEIDCGNWAIEVTAPSGQPYTSLLFDTIALYDPEPAERAPATPCARSLPSERSVKARACYTQRKLGSHTLQ